MVHEDAMLQATVATRIELQPGTAVQVRGLKAASSLNGVLGICLMLWGDEQNRRWIVQLSNGELKAVRRDNLILSEVPSEEQLHQQQRWRDTEQWAPTRPLTQVPSMELAQAMLQFSCLAKKLGASTWALTSTWKTST